MNSNKKKKSNFLNEYAVKNGFYPWLKDAAGLENLISKIDFYEGNIRISYWKHENIFLNNGLILCNLSESDSSFGRRGSSTSQRSVVIFKCARGLKTLIQITKENKVNILYRQEEVSENKLSEMLDIGFNNLPHILQMVFYNGIAIIYFIPMFTTEKEEDISYLIRKAKELKNIL